LTAVLFGTIVLATTLFPYQYTEFSAQPSVLHHEHGTYDLHYAWTFAWLPLCHRRCDNATLAPHLAASGTTIGGISNVWATSSCRLARDAAYSASVAGSFLAVGIQISALLMAACMLLLGLFITCSQPGNCPPRGTQARDQRRSRVRETTASVTVAVVCYLAMFFIAAFAVPLQLTTFDVLDHQPVGNVTSETVLVKHNFRLCYLWIIGEDTCRINVPAGALNTTRSFGGYASFPRGSTCVADGNSRSGPVGGLALWAFWTVCVSLACLFGVGMSWLFFATAIEWRVCKLRTR
jgi:hypothetical protein